MLVALLSGCPSEAEPTKVAATEPATKPTTAATPTAETTDDSSPTEPAIAWASDVHTLNESERAPKGPSHERAVIPDRAYASNTLIAVRRLVYRVHFLVPKSFREHRTLVRPPAGELTLDVSNDRLRAHFTGPAWPLREGTQVRLRRDTLGVYVFDGSGGRQLSPGQLALWFEGRGSPRATHASVRVRRETGKVAPGPGELVCALLAEWTGQARDNVMRRCIHGALPPGFAFGPWRAELTAVVPMELPASQMRADELDPPTLPRPTNIRPVLASHEMAQIQPLRAQPGDVPSDTPPGEDTTLTITNHNDARALVCAAGVPVAWIDGNTEGVIHGLATGRHMIGALRAFGGLSLTRRAVQVPGELTLRALP